MNIFRRGPSFADVNYESGNTISIVDNRFFVETDFYDEIAQRVLEMYPYLVIDGDYTAWEIVGIDYWSGLTPLRRNLCLLVLKDLTEQDNSLISGSEFDHRTELVFRTNDPCFDVVSPTRLRYVESHQE